MYKHIHIIIILLTQYYNIINNELSSSYCDTVYYIVDRPNYIAIINVMFLFFKLDIFQRYYVLL